MVERERERERERCVQTQPLISIVQYFIENEGITHGRKFIKASWWQLLNGCIPLRIPCISCVQHLVVSWHETLSFYVWK